MMICIQPKKSDQVGYMAKEARTTKSFWSERDQVGWMAKVTRVSSKDQVGYMAKEASKKPVQMKNFCSEKGQAGWMLKLASVIKSLRFRIQPCLSIYGENTNKAPWKTDF